MSIRYSVNSIAVCAVALAISGCGDMLGPNEGPSLKAELIRLPETASAGAFSSVDMPIAAPAAPGEYAWSSDISITSFRSPIRSIRLTGDNQGTTVYECEAENNDDCLIDLAGPALQDLLGAEQVTVNPGTYTNVLISTCEDEGEYQAYLTGQVSIDGATWLTKTTGVLDTAGTAEPVQLPYSGCGRNYPLPDSLVIEDSTGAPISVKLYFDIRDFAWASLGTEGSEDGWLPSGCTGSHPHTIDEVTPFVCAGYPDVAGTVDSVMPVIERYRINDAATIGLIFTGSGGDFVGGYTRRFFNEGTAAQPGFTADTPIEVWTDNGDGTYYLASFGGAGPDGGPIGHYLTIEEFRRETHDGVAAGYTGNTFEYSAVKIR